MYKPINKCVLVMQEMTCTFSILTKDMAVPSSIDPFPLISYNLLKGFMLKYCYWIDQQEGIRECCRDGP